MSNADEHAPAAANGGRQPKPVKIAFVLYPGLTALDAIAIAIDVIGVTGLPMRYGSSEMVRGVRAQLQTAGGHVVTAPFAVRAR